MLVSDYFHGVLAGGKVTSDFTFVALSDMNCTDSRKDSQYT